MKKIALLAMSIASPLAWSHAGNNTATVVHACYDNSDGDLSIVRANASCKARETALHWNIQGIQGPQGIRGLTGATGATGAVGPRGLQGIAGTNGINGAKGDKGDPGLAGTDGTNGIDGKSAYEIAVANGYTGTAADLAGNLKR
jgi:Collagen triple helix repeat (20 copies)